MNLIIPGTPQPLRRHRTTRTGRTYDDARNPINREAVRLAWLTAADEGQVQADTIGVRATFVFPRPKSHFLRGVIRDTAPYWHTKTPDVDNLVKLVLDALNGYAYGDDAQVVAISATKRYCGAHEEPHTQLWIGEWYGDAVD